MAPVSQIRNQLFPFFSSSFFSLSNMVTRNRYRLASRRQTPCYGCCRHSSLQQVSSPTIPTSGKLQYPDPCSLFAPDVLLLLPRRRHSHAPSLPCPHRLGAPAISESGGFLCDVTTRLAGTGLWQKHSGTWLRAALAPVLWFSSCRAS